ncbi:MAG: hypothetical protein FJ320_10380 [SAR202 cluster bacterium]|nr:hypothetical protein [SAR202 cluster bacterium]
MRYAKVITSVREALISLEPIGWGRPYRELQTLTDVSGYEKWLAYSTGNFSNPFQQADEDRFRSRGWWAEIVRDTVREGGKGVDRKGRLNLVYISHVGTEWERAHGGKGEIWAPQNGWYVPTDDDVIKKGVWIPFHEGTLIPRETVQDRKEALRRLEARGISAQQASCLYRHDSYPEEMFVGVGFYPWAHALGRFTADNSRLPSYHGGLGVGSRPAYNPATDRNPEIVMEVDARL